MRVSVSTERNSTVSPCYAGRCTFLVCKIRARFWPRGTHAPGKCILPRPRVINLASGSLPEPNMNLSRTTLKKAYPYLGICEFCGGVLELSYYDFVLECAVCKECAEDLARGEEALTAAGIVSPGTGISRDRVLKTWTLIYEPNLFVSFCLLSAVSSCCLRREDRPSRFRDRHLLSNPE